MPDPSGHILRFSCASVCWFLPKKKTNMPPKGHQYSMPLETVFRAIYQLTDTLVLISVSCKMLDVTRPWEIACSRKLVDFTFQRDKTMVGHSLQGAIWIRPVWTSGFILLRYNLPTTTAVLGTKVNVKEKHQPPLHERRRDLRVLKEDSWKSKCLVAHRNWCDPYFSGNDRVLDALSHSLVQNRTQHSCLSPKLFPPHPSGALEPSQLSPHVQKLPP